MAKILVLEDLEDSFIPIYQSLHKEHTLHWVKSITEAQKAFDESYDLALVDVFLPDGEGYEYCHWLRRQEVNSTIPVIFISANSGVDSRITGFTVGGDDYISKPINGVELKLRVENKLARGWNAAVLKRNGLGVEVGSQRARVYDEGESKDLNLTPIEFKILYAFLVEPEKIFNRDELIARIWGEEVHVFHRSVDTHVSKLRKKLGAKADLIKSVHGIGYRFSQVP